MTAMADRSKKRKRLALAHVVCAVMAATACCMAAAQRVADISPTLDSDVRADSSDRGQMLVSRYQDLVSGVKNGHCAMFPSCSNYGMMAIQRHGFVRAVPMIADRLARCSRDQQFYRPTHVRGFHSLVDYPPGFEVPDSICAHVAPTPLAPVLKLRRGRDTAEVVVANLINREDYPSALAEIERRSLSGSSLSPTLVAFRMKCERAQGKPLTALYDYSLLADSVRSDKEVALQAAMAQYELKEYAAAQQTIGRALAGGSMLRASDEGDLRVVGAVAAMRSRQWDEADRQWATAIDCGVLNADTCRSMSAACREERWHKSPGLARGLSAVVPGLGFLYARHKGSFVSSLVVNALMGYATYTSYKTGNYGVMALCGFLSLSFYIGGIGGSGRAAERHNDQHREHIMDVVEELHLSHY